MKIRDSKRLIADSLDGSCGHFRGSWKTLSKMATVNSKNHQTSNFVILLCEPG